jgi:hypothetical protein
MSIYFIHLTCTQLHLATLLDVRVDKKMGIIDNLPRYCLPNPLIPLHPICFLFHKYTHSLYARLALHYTRLLCLVQV